MRRALPAIVVSAAGITWLLHAQGAIDAQHSSAGSHRASGSTSSSDTNSSTDSGTSTESTGPGTGQTDSGAGTTTTAAPSTGSSGGTRTVAGETFDTRYGPVQVEAVISGKKLIDVKVDQYPTDRQRSQEINDQALPMLHDEAIQAQSANLDGVGGATYTTEGYMQSLQSALDKAHFGS